VRGGRLAALLIATLLVGIAAQAHAATPKKPKPTVGAQLNAYLKAMHTAVAHLTSDDSGVAFAGSLWDADEKTIDANELDATFYHVEAPQLINDKAFYEKAVSAAYANAKHQAPVLAHVKAPAAMHRPHALLAAAARTFGGSWEG
jgi:hypothetical protein